MLKADYPNREAAGRQIVEGIEEYYRTMYPEAYMILLAASAATMDRT